jgi:hypothetical protein
MLSRISQLWTARTPEPKPRVAAEPPRFRPQFETFEDRVVPAAPIVITDVDLTSFDINGTVLEAAGIVEGTVAGLPFVADVAAFTLQLVPDDPATPSVVECSVLDLQLGPINLALLGLHVDTSPICLEVTAVEGGGLLGDLLCGLAGGGLLGTGLPILPTDAQAITLEDTLGTLFNGAFGQAQAGPGGGDESVCTGETEILHLVLGPVDLSLLGLNVSLDDCADGPVQVCVSATAGEGLLGDLLGGLGGFPNLNLDIDEVAQILGVATDFLDDGDISGRERGQLNSLINRLARR